ncbi:unnamed protein product [Larinioides sclopetarius]|uniref:BZIP domain-containing protein n=1 Tax=Larinioides sclopetarius TaxID=280406 RepID=A0AAV2BI22_9ARAC
MSTQSHETSKEKEFENGEKEKSHCSPDIPKLGESTFAVSTNCVDMIHSDMRKTSNCVVFDGMQPSDIPKFKERISHDNLERLYICKIDESKLNSGRIACFNEQPLDFSRKPISSDRKDELPQKFQKFEVNPAITTQDSQENSANSSDCVDDSFDDEEKSECFRVYSHANRTRVPREAFLANGTGNTVSDEREERPHKMSNLKFGKWFKGNKYKRNGLKTVNSSGSEDESSREYSLYDSRINDQNDDNSQITSSYNGHLSIEGKKSPHSQHTESEMLHVSNRPSENGCNITTEKNGRFYIQGILSRDNQSARKAEHLETGHQIYHSITQQRTNPQSPFNRFGKEDNLASRSISPNQTVNIPPGPSSPRHPVNIHPGPSSPRHTVNIPPGPSSPNHSMNLPPGYTNPSPLPPSRFQFGATDRLHESNGMIPPFMQTVFPPNHIANFMNHNSPREATDYSRLYSYPPGALLQPTLNPMYAQPYQPSLLVGQDQQRQKKQRPFKNIDPSVLMQHLPIAQTEEALNYDPSPSSTYNSPTIKHAESNGPTAMDTSPQLSPDSPCLVNGSSGNESLPQEINDECGRKKIRRIPPEEKDEKYLEKRRKNNLAAKKSRDERRRKEDMLAVTCKGLLKMKVALEASNQILYQNLANKEQKLDMIIGRLISYREKCEGRTKEVFEETFKLFLPPQ